jgi:DNA-binding response OmpR family regulator
MRILVVDDEAEIRDVLSVLLSTEDLDVVTARNGREAIQMALSSPPDMILMDIHMPVLDGVTATTLLKRHSVTAHIPIIAMSAGRHLRQHISGLRADSIIAKPFDLDELLAHIGLYDRPAMQGADAPFQGYAW